MMIKKVTAKDRIRVRLKINLKKKRKNQGAAWYRSKGQQRKFSRRRKILGEKHKRGQNAILEGGFWSKELFET